MNTSTQSFSETLRTVSLVMVCAGGITAGLALTIEAVGGLIHLFRR